HTRVEIRGQRTGCTAGAGCTGTDWVILATWDINPQPTGPTLDTKTPDLAAVCSGQTISATFVAGTGGVGCTDSFQYRYDGTGLWTAYTPGSTIITTGHTLIEIQGRRTGCTTGSGCSETPWETLVSWVVNPYPVLNSTLTPDPICSGSAFSYTPESSVPLTGFAWTRAAVAGILPGTDGSGNGNPNEVLENTTSAPITVRYQYVLSANGCTNSTIFNVDVIVNPMPVMSSTLTPDPVCSGTTFTYIPQSLTTGTTFDWTRAEVAGISTSGSGSGTDNPNEILTNNTNNPVTVSYVYTLTANGCTDPSDFIVKVTVNPTADVAQPDDQVACNDGAIADIEFTTGNSGGTVTYTWSNDTPSIGLADAGSGNIPSFTATNTTLVPVVATIVVKPHFENEGVTCDGPVKTFTITVNPTADVAQPDDQVACNDGATADIEFTTGNSGGTVTYTWSNDTPSIGLAGTGSGNIPSFTATNSTLAPVVAEIVVTPHFENEGVTCDGPVKTFTITVNPTADVVQPANQVVCNDAPTLDIVFTTGNTIGVTTYTWVNDTPSIGLGESGNGDIPLFIAVNDGDAPVTATIEVTPHFTYGGITCDGPSKTFTITVDPTPQIIPSTLTQTICNNGQTNIVIGSPSTYSSGVITFDYTVTATGGVTGFTTPVTGLPKDHVIEDTLVNPTNEIQTVTYTITPVTATGCGSGPATVIVTVLPTPLVAEPADQVLCNGELSSEVVPATLTIGDVTFTWTNTDPSIGLPASGEGNIPSFAVVNNGDSPVVAEISIVPHFTFAGFMCDGQPRVFTITVNPTPRIYPEPEDIIQCDSTNTSIGLQSPSTFSAGLISFKYTAVATGGVTGYTPVASGLPNDHVITDNLVNPTNSPQTVTYTITPVSPITGCNDGPSVDVVVTVNPTPRIYPVDPIIQCDSTTTSITLQSPSTFTEGNVSFRYTAVATGGVTGYTPAASGLSNNHVIEDFLVNPTDSPQTVTYTVTPESPVAGCSDGPSIDVVVRIDPTPRLIPVVPPPQCDSTTTSITLHSPSTFTSGVIKFRYTASAPAGITGYTLSASNLPNDHAIADFLVNLTDSPQTVTYKVTPVSPPGCNDGPSIDIEVIVNPTPRIYPEPDDIIQCDSTATDITLESPSTFTTGLVTFGFTASATGGVTGFTPNASGLPNNHVIADNLVNPTDLPQTVTYTITPVSPLGCNDGPSVNVLVTVNPTPRIIPVAPVIQCDSTTTAISLQSPSTFTTGLITFKYTASAPAEVAGYTASATDLQNNHVITDNLVNLSDSPQTVTYHVVPVSPLPCADGPGIDIAVTINPTPRISPVPQDIIICDSTTTSIMVESPSTFTNGLVTINYTASAPAGLSGYTGNAAGLSSGFIISDNLVNTTDAPVTVTYRLVPVSGVVCNTGPAIEVKVTVNPTPRAVPVNVSPDICYGDLTAIRLESPTIMTSGEIRFDYDIAIPSGVVAGDPDSGINMMPGDILSLKYSNTNDTVQSAFFSITPKVEGLNCPAGNASVQEVHLHPRPVRGITVVEPFTCETSVGLAALQADISRGAGPYTVSWEGPVGYSMEDSLVITNLYAGFYELYVTDNLGCQGDTTINIFNQSARPRIIPAMVLPNIHVSCPGGNDGTARIYVRDGAITYPFEYWFVRDDAGTLYHGVFSNVYSWDDPTTYQVCESLTAGNYTLIVKDINGCETIGQAVLKEPDPIEVSMDLSDYRGSNISCRGYSDGFVEAGATGGTAPYSYFWYPESGALTVSTNTSRLDSIPAGKYYLLVTDFMGCTKTDSITLTDPPGMDLASSEMSHSNDNIYNISCNGAGDGYIKIVVIGGSGNYTYSWTGPDGYSAVTKDISGLKAGTYTCTVTDINGCILTPKPEFTLKEPAPLVISYVSSVSTDGDFNITCAGGTGTVDVTVTGGSIGNYTFLWTTADGSGIVAGEQDQNSLTAGIYHLRVTDLNGCIAETDITLTEPPALVTELVPTHINCQVAGFDNGSIDLEVSGGIAPYSYLWSNGAITQDISGLTQGMYQVEVTDASGCETSGSILIENPPPLTYEPVISDYNGYNISCYGRSDGSIQINPTSGSPPYIFSWEGPEGFTATTKDISGMTAGSYILSIIDSKMCTVSEMIVLAEPGRLGMTVTTSESITGGKNIDCAGGKTGSISVESVNNAGSVDYLWSDGEMGSTRTGLMAGYYKVITIDSNGCTADSTILLTEPDSIVISFAVTRPQCTDMPDGRININVTGGTNSGFTYLWSDNSTTRNISTAVSGVYSVTVTDANGCSATRSVTINPVNDLCLELPNAISPNGDNINDLWNIGLRELYPEMEVTIFNRWGETVWKSGRGYPVPWDGRSNGNMLPMDSYHYIIDLQNGRKPIIGTITIVK
ncbi:MAG: PKD-like domain-containing protein, partial [Bacteroidales bacterium]